MTERRMSDREQEIVVCAIRYALGCRTYVVDDVSGYALDNIAAFSHHWLRVVASDIGRLEERGGDCLGDRRDAEAWRSLRDAAEKRLGESDPWL